MALATSAGVGRWPWRPQLVFADEEDAGKAWPPLVLEHSHLAEEMDSHDQAAGQRRMQSYRRCQDGSQREHAAVQQAWCSIGEGLAQPDCGSPWCGIEIQAAL